MQHSHLNVEMSTNSVNILCRIPWNACFCVLKNKCFSHLPCRMEVCCCIAAVAHLKDFKFYIGCGLSALIVNCSYRRDHCFSFKMRKQNI